MAVTDPIADLLTRIRNASSAGHKRLSLPSSKLKREVVRVLNDANFLRGFAEQPATPQNQLLVRLRYTPTQEQVINGLERVSRPGLRRYITCDKLRSMNRQMGLTVVSTSRGVMSGRQAVEHGIGGEILCRVW
ncbi:MAG TPA: 30S ribosomal protein S8 [candidate division Zixibacteria bacterium]|jgi:small subunit ribosomal protein S8